MVDHSSLLKDKISISSRAVSISGKEDPTSSRRVSTLVVREVGNRKSALPSTVKATANVDLVS